MEGPLSGIRVLALENYLAGPVASMVMGDLGAEVIKIEPPQGDRSRLSIGPNHKGESNHYLSYNRSKKGIVLDLRAPMGKQAFFDLVKISDVVINNFRAGAMARLGIDYEALKKINPRIICTGITGMGPSGPYKDMPANDSVASGLSGLLSVTGESDGRPLRPAPAVCDLTSSLYAVIGTMAALQEREKTGAGQNVDVSLLGSAVALMGYYVSYFTLSGLLPERLGSGYPYTVPFGVYKTRDGYIVLGECWPRIARALGAEWLIDDPRFAKYEDRLQNRRQLDEEIEKIFMRMDSEAWLEILRGEDITAGPVHTIDQTVADPQVNHINMMMELEHSLGGTLKLAGNPVMMASLKHKKYLPPPTLGQHTDDVLRDLLGYSEDKRRKLKEEQAIYAPETELHTRKLR